MIIEIGAGEGNRTLVIINKAVLFGNSVIDGNTWPEHHHSRPFFGVVKDCLPLEPTPNHRTVVKLSRAEIESSECREDRARREK